MHKFLYLFSFLFAFGTSALAQEVSLEASSTSIRYGEAVTASVSTTITAQQKKAGFSIPDSVSKFLGGLELIDAPKIDTTIEENESGFNFTYTLSLQVSGFDSGRFELGPIPFLLGTDSLFSNAVYVDVYPVALDTTAAPKPIKEIVEIPLTFSDYVKAYWHFPVLAAVLAVLCYLLYRFLKSRKRKPISEIVAPQEPEIPAHESALEQLRKLENEKAWSKMEEKAFYSSITNITRVYLKKRFGFNATEQTSQEIIDSLRYKLQPKSLLSDLQEVLNVADMVKFAKEKPGESYAKDAIANAIKLVEKTALNEEEKDQENG